MFISIWEDIKQQFRSGNMVNRLIIINVFVFLIIVLVKVALQISYAYEASIQIHEFMGWISISSDWMKILLRPWTVVTSLFVHADFWHILGNMLLFFWFGRIFGDLVGDQRVLPLYLLAGLAGNLVYFITANTLGYMKAGSGIAYGASGAVMGTVMAAAALAPDMEMRLLLLGNVRIKYIAAVLLIIDILGVGSMSNTGGHFAHLGGALCGYLFVYQLRRGTDWAASVNGFFRRVSDFFRGIGQPGAKPRKGPRVAYRNPENIKKQGAAATARRSSKMQGKADGPSLSHQERIDAILEKIKESGYDNLTQEEKEYLFNASKNN